MRTLHNIITAFVALVCARLVSADSFSMQKYFCVFADEVGYIATYNWTTTTKSIVWDNCKSYARNDDACPTMCGTECNNDCSECWAVPELQCYPRITGEVWPDPPKYSCLQADESRICGNEQALEIDGKRFSPWYEMGLAENGKTAQLRSRMCTHLATEADEVGLQSPQCQPEE